MLKLIFIFHLSPQQKALKKNIQTEVFNAVLLVDEHL